MSKNERPLLWIASSYSDLMQFPPQVIDDMGFALGLAQEGGISANAKPWKGEGGGVFEIAEPFEGNAYRTVYAVRFARAVYVLHCFQKKSPSGVRTALTDVELIHKRLTTAQKDYEARYGKDK